MTAALLLLAALVPDPWTMSYGYRGESAQVSAPLVGGTYRDPGPPLELFGWGDESELRWIAWDCRDPGVSFELAVFRPAGADWAPIYVAPALDYLDVPEPAAAAALAAALYLLGRRSHEHPPDRRKPGRRDPGGRRA